MKYRYLYQTSDNENKEGEIRASSRENAYAKLRKQGIRPYRLIGNDPLPWKPWALALLLIVLTFALSVVSRAYFMSDRTPIARSQLVGDRSLIFDGIRSGWKDVLKTPLDRYLAAYAEPGNKAKPPLLTPDEMESFVNALETPIEYVRGEPPEYRQLKNIVAGMREDMRKYLLGGGSSASYLEFLDERQQSERELREKAIASINRAPAPYRYQAWKNANRQLQARGIEPIAVPDGIEEDF